MSTTLPEHQSTSPHPPKKNRALKVALLMVAFIGGFYLLREHWNHVAGNWIYLLLLACPMMHFFHGHGGHGGQATQANKPANKEQ